MLILSRWKLLWTFILEANRKTRHAHTQRKQKLYVLIWMDVLLDVVNWFQRVLDWGYTFFLFGLSYIIYGRYNETTKEKNEPRNWKKKKIEKFNTRQHFWYVASPGLNRPTFFIRCYTHGLVFGSVGRD